MFSELAANESSFAEFLRSPIIDPKKRDASLVRMLMDQVEPVTLNFLRLLNNKGRLAAPARHRGSRQGSCEMPPPVAFE